MRPELVRSWTRDRVAAMLALVTVFALASAFVFSRGTAFLMPGPLTSAHGAIEKCGACHTKSGGGKVTWVHGLVAGDPRADAEACLTCHKMPETALNPHGASEGVLKASTERLTKIAATTPQPHAAHAQNFAFPADVVMARGLFCATCHQEHKGANFNLNKITDEQCRSCHVVKFDAFDGGHPKFDAYPFKQRTRIIYDHAGHFGKHYPEVAKKDPAKRIPETCSTCHNSRDDKRIMAVAPFDKTCAACHLDQIVGKERVSGPKGVAFLSLPGLDLETLKKKNAPIGEWPEGSEASLTPFMRVILGRNEKGRALIGTLAGLDLQDLTKATDGQIKAVTELAWEIKRLFHALISGKASDALAELNIVSGAKLSAGLIADLTASIPRDVVISAHQQWLPNLASEIANGPIQNNQPQNGAAASAPGETEPASAARDDAPDADEPEAASADSATDAGGKSESVVKRDPPACLMRVLGQCLVSKEPEKRDGENPPAGKPPGAMNLGAASEPKAGASTNIKTMRVGDKADDLLHPTEEEQREMKARRGGAGNGGASSDKAAPAADEPAAAARSNATPVISIDSNVDPESWAEYGGWYRQDHAIFYRPTGHKDKFMYSWLFLTGPQAAKGAATPAAAVFDSLTGKEAQGSCTKCHSIDDIPGKGRAVNFSPPSAATKQGRFTRFIHEPHFGILDDRGCLTCHTLEKGRPYLKSYEQGDPHAFAAGFGEVKKDLCQTCHNVAKARQNCLTCHKYHVNDVVTPVTSTKLPIQ